MTANSTLKFGHEIWTPTPEAKGVTEANRWCGVVGTKSESEQQGCGRNAEADDGRWDSRF